MTGSSLDRTTDYLVIGGGVIGLTIALEIRRRYPDASVTLIEKEEACGMHASGRNSGVLHAGFYYTKDSLKARFSRDGNRDMTEYCLDRGLRINQCGKLVVARNEAELEGLDELFRRAEVNGVDLQPITEKEAHELEPRARTFDRALFSPTTSSIDPVEVMASLVRDAERANISVVTEAPYLGRDGDEVRTPRGSISAGYVVNAAGLYADRIARDYGFSEDYRILPFKGLYLYETSGRDSLARHVYPVPELRYPFLGVHFTVTALGKVKIGPTAIPAFWRENYEGLQGLRVDELLEVGLLELDLFVRNSFDFRTLAARELRKHSMRVLTSQAAELVDGLADGSTWKWGRPGIRAQLVNIRERKLEMDFAFEGDDRSCHVLNAVSPAFTCSMPFASYMLDRIASFTNRKSAPEATSVSGLEPTTLSGV